MPVIGWEDVSNRRAEVKAYSCFETRELLITVHQCDTGARIGRPRWPTLDISTDKGILMSRNIGFAGETIVLSALGFC
jgi:hypothetical protein